MAKKQPKPDSTRRRNRVEPSTQRVQPTNSPSKNLHSSNNKFFGIFFVVVFIVFPAISILIFLHLKNSHPPTSFVHQRGLVKSDVNFQEILTVNLSLSLFYNTNFVSAILWVFLIVYGYLLKLQSMQENSRVSDNVSHRHFSNPVLAYITPWYVIFVLSCPSIVWLWRLVVAPCSNNLTKVLIWYISLLNCNLLNFLYDYGD